MFLMGCAPPALALLCWSNYFVVPGLSELYILSYLESVICFSPVHLRALILPLSFSIEGDHRTNDLSVVYKLSKTRFYCTVHNRWTQ